MLMNQLAEITAGIQTRSISPENFTGEPGQGGRATEGTGANCARDLGQGWKVSPSVKIEPGQTFVLADIKGEGAIRHIWITDPPKQQRSREAWNRVLDAGVAILEDGGYDAFTIAAVCRRAQVAPTAIYARTTSKDALFLAVYEHGIAELLTEQEVFRHDGRWAGLSKTECGIHL